VPFSPEALVVEQQIARRRFSRAIASAYDIPCYAGFALGHARRSPSNTLSVVLWKRPAEQDLREHHLFKEGGKFFHDIPAFSPIC
jgi:hypothetical protein